MKAHSDQLLTIEEIADKVLFELGYGAHRKELFLSYALDYYRRYRRDLAREFKKVRLDMTPWKSVILPNDCVDPIAIGIPNGESFDIFTNKRLNPRDCACDEDAPTEPVYVVEEGSEGIQFNSVNEFGQDVGKQNLLVMDNGLGYFDINREQGVNEIQLSASVKAGTRPLLIYLSSLIDPSIHKCVHPYAQDYIEAGIHWSNLKNRRRAGDKKISPQDIRDAKEEHDEQLCHLAEMRWDFSSADIMEIVRSGARMSPKR